MVSRSGFQILGRRLLHGKNRIKTLISSRKYTDDRYLGDTVNIPSKQKVTDLPPLTEPVPGLPKPIYANILKERNETHVTTLPNGLRVASEKRFGQFCTVGVLIDSGPRYEVAFPSGINHFLEKLSFNSTANYAEKDKILAELELHGGICDAQSSRDTFVYATSTNVNGLETVVQILSEAVLRPAITDHELESARDAVQFELESLNMRPEQEPILMDMIHAAAYRENTLGLPKICPVQNLYRINKSIIFTYLKHHYVPKRMVIAGVGVDHEKLVDLVDRHFVQEPAIWESNPDLLFPGKFSVDESVAQYTGGLVQEVCEIPEFAGHALPKLSHVVIGLEGCSHQDEDFIPLCVLNMMMGGGGSFSAGGPGKGMYTRLYTSVLNRYHWMYNATAYNHAYADTGLFCIHASAPPNHVRELTEIIVREMVHMTSSPNDVELARAKKQLQSMLLMNLEARPVVFEDIGRQVLATGHRKPPEFFIDAIEKVTQDDIVRVARKLLSSQPSVAARGEINKLPNLQEIQAGLLDSDGRMPRGNRRLSLFR